MDEILAQSTQDVPRTGMMVSAIYACISDVRDIRATPSSYDWHTNISEYLTIPYQAVRMKGHREI